MQRLRKKIPRPLTYVGHGCPRANRPAAVSNCRRYNNNYYYQESVTLHIIIPIVFKFIRNRCLLGAF